MTLSEAESYSKLLRQAGMYATPMWHWGNSSYAVVVANKLHVISTASEMTRWIEMHRVWRSIDEREQEERARSGLRQSERSIGAGDDS